VWNNGSVQVNPSGEPQAVTISIDPVVTNIFSGNNFDVSVNITEVIDLNSVQYDILFDPAIISLAEVSPGNVGGTAIPVDDNEIDSGHWRVVQYLLGTANGSGYLSKITFHAIQTGQSSINLTDGLVSGFNGPIPANWNPGFVNVGEYVGPELISVNVTPKTNQIYTGGDTVQLTAKAYYDDGSSVDVTADAAWESDNESAATVAAGFVTSEARGTADTVMITATYNGQSDTAEVTTFEPAVTGVTVTPNPAEVSVGKILQFTATASFEFGPDENVTVMAEWSTSNENIATVGTLGNGTPGLVYGEGIGGPITVGAIYGGEAGSASLTVIASALVSVNVTQKTNQIFTGGDTVQLTATAYYENGSSKNVTTDADWSSNNPTIASVGAGTGLVTSGARGTAGTVNISATYNGMLDIARVTTVEPALTGINVIPNPAEVAVDKTLQFTATGSFEFGPNENITNKVDWTSNNTPVATIETVGGSNPGLASGISTGTATIKALLDDQEGTATLTVTEGNIAIVAVNNGAMISLIEGGTAEASSTSGIPVSIIDPGQPVAAAGLVLHYDTRIFTITEAYVSNEAKAAFPSIAATNINNEYDTENHTGRLSIALQNAQTPTEFTSMDVVYFGVNVTGNTGDTSTVMVTVDSLKAPGLVPIEYTAINAPVEILQKVLETITILPENPAVPAGLTIQLSAMGTYNTGTENITDIATWTSSNNSIATVNPQGLVQTLKKGNVNITATMDSVSNTTGLMVLDPLLVNLEVTPEAAEIATGGDTVQLSAIATYTDSSTENVTAEANWTSSNETKAIVVAGLVTSGAKGTAGTATITATYEGKSDTSEITTVEPALTSIEVTPEGAKLSPGFSRQYTATGTYEDQSQKVITTEVQWISSDTTVATTSPDGKVTAVNEGTTSITAKLDQITSDPVTLTVQEMAIVTVNNGETISLAPGSIVEASETTGIPVSIANPGSPIANAGFKLYYDTEIFTITKAYVSTEGKAAFPSLKNTNVNNEYDVDNHIGQLIIALQNTDEPQEFTSMDVVYFGVNVTGNAGDTSVVEITVDTLKTPYMTTIEHTTVNAPVSITSSVAEISSRQMLNKDNIAVVQLSIDRIKAPGSGDTVNLAGGLGSFAGKFTMLDGNMEILKVLPASGFTNMVYDLQAGTFSADAISPDQPNNTPVAELVVKLTGNATDKNHLKVEFTSIKNASGDVDVPGEAPLEMAFLRGDLYDDPTHPDEVNLDDSYVAAMIYLTKFDPSPYLVVNGAGAYHEQGKELGVDLDDSYVLAMRYLTKFDIYFQYVP
ncbi:MAG: Ig-like domain-containing protein, partial [Dehalococcoidales bacterium]|nr:Ig-like domain-containing protein [Dehalococcoidales bacterium]